MIKNRHNNHSIPLFSYSREKKIRNLSFFIKYNVYKSQKLDLTNLQTKIIFFEYFNNLSKHFVGSRNPFLSVFVLIWHFNSISSHFNTGGFMKKVLSVYTHSMTTIYLSLSAQVAISTFFMKSPLALAHLNSTEKMHRLSCPKDPNSKLCSEKMFFRIQIGCLSDFILSISIIVVSLLYQLRGTYSEIIYLSGCPC